MAFQRSGPGGGICRKRLPEPTGRGANDGARAHGGGGGQANDSPSRRAEQRAVCCTGCLGGGQTVPLGRRTGGALARGGSALARGGSADNGGSSAGF